MRIHNLYADEKGETHFRDIDVEWKNEGPGGKTSATFPATVTAKRGVIALTVVLMAGAMATAVITA